LFKLFNIAHISSQLLNARGACGNLEECESEIIADYIAT